MFNVYHSIVFLKLNGYHINVLYINQPAKGIWSFPEEEKTFFVWDPPKNIPRCIDTLCVCCHHIEGVLTESAMGYDKNYVTSVSSLLGAIPSMLRS